MTQNDRNEIVSREQLDEYVREVAKAAGYPSFGAEGCDLNERIWWAAYTRQSREEQAKNNRIPEYLLTCARMAKDKGVVVPREYIFVDHESSDYLDRKYMLHLRKDLIAGCKISGVLIPSSGPPHSRCGPAEYLREGMQLLWRGTGLWRCAKRF